MPASPVKNILKKGNTVYLWVNGEWYQYDDTAAPVGAGAMGIVYLGYHCSTHSRVAIKMVRQKYADVAVIRRRARQEASLMFMHPNLIEMLGCCEYATGKGAFWILSKFVQGVTIDKYLTGMMTVLSTDTTVRICRMFYPVLEALHYLHTGARPIFHLDIKPTNIMVEGGNNVRLMDLGIASAFGQMAIGGLGMMGTPNYAAPEQFDSSYGQINEMTDVYQAAVTLYELLTRNNPYNSSSITETCIRHKEMELPSASCIPLPLLNVLRRATNPLPVNRYHSVTEFKYAIEAALEESLKSKRGGYLIPIVIGSAIVVCIVIALLYMYIFILQ